MTVMVITIILIKLISFNAALPAVHLITATPSDARYQFARDVTVKYGQTTVPRMQAHELKSKLPETKGGPMEQI